MHRGANLIVDLKRISTREMRFDRKGKGKGREENENISRVYFHSRSPKNLLDRPLPPPQLWNRFPPTGTQEYNQRLY